MTAKYRTPLLVIGGLFVLWGVIGLFDIGNIPYSGFLTDPSRVVTRIDAGSPAEAAGLQVGDRITHLNGVPVEDTPAMTRMPRAAVGETRTLVVETAEMTLAAGDEGPATREISITFTSLPARDTALTWVAFVLGLCFIGCGLLAYTKVYSRSSLLLAITGLLLGVAFIGGPYISSYALRTLVTTLVLVMVVFGLATLLHFLLEFPKPKAMLQKKHITWVLYAPAVIMALFFAWLIIFEPPATAGLNTLGNTLTGILVVGYFGLSVVALIHSYVKATAEERSRFGLNWLLVGVLVGLLPLTIGSLIVTLAPSVVPPGVDFYFVTMILIPITMALAVMRSAPPARPAPVM